MAGSSYWDIIAAGVAAYFANKGTSGGTPNQYPTVLPPEVKRVADEAWNVYKAGGSPAQQDVRSAGTQFLAGMPTTAPNFSFTSNALKGGTFAGGVTLPKIDVSKFSGGGSGVNANVPPPKTALTKSEKFPNFGGGPSGLAARRQDDLGASLDDESIYGAMTRDPSLTGRRIQDQFGRDNLKTPAEINNSGVPATSDPAIFGKVKDAFSQWQKAHPNWAALGPKAAIGFITGGIPGLAIGTVEGIIRQLFMPPPKPVPPPPTPTPVGGRL